MSLFSSNATQTNKLLGYQLQSSIYGRPIPIVYGQMRIAGTVIWTGNWDPVPGAPGSGKKAGKDGNIYTYYTSIMVALCQGPIRGVGSVWMNNVRLFPGSALVEFTVTSTGLTYTPEISPLIDNGVSQLVVTTPSGSSGDYGAPPGTVTITATPTPAKLTSVPLGQPLQPGQYSYDPTTGTYHFAPGDAGITVSIFFGWVDPLYVVDGNIIEYVGMELFAGLQGQAPWPFLNNPTTATQALGYTNVAYLASESMDLGTGGVLGNFGWEVYGFFPYGGGIVDAAISDVIPDFLSNPLYGTGFPAGAIGDISELRNYTIASNIFISCALTEQRTATEWLQEWLTIANCEAVWSNGVLKFRCYGDKTVIGNNVVYTPNTTPIYDLDDDDFIGDREKPLFNVTRPTVRDAYNSVSVEWTNRGNSYQQEPVEEQDDWAISLYGLRKAPINALHSITTNIVGQAVANTQLQRSVYIRNQYKFKVSAIKYMLLEPMDMVTVSEIEEGLYKTPVRIKSIAEDEELGIDIEAEEFPWGTATPTEFPKQTIGPFGPLYFSNPGNTVPVIFYEPDPPAVITNGAINTLLIGLAGSSNWGGCQVYVSTDGGNSYTPIGKQQGSSTVGYLSNELPAVTDPDNTSTLSIDMSISGKPLKSYSAAQENAFISLCVVDQELISYQTATLTDPNAYNLTSLRRAVYESPLSAHNTGAPFAFFDDTMFVWQFAQSNVNTTVFFKFLSFNKAGLQQQTLSQAQAWPYFIHGERPPYPWSTHDNATLPITAATDLYRSPNFGIRQKLLTDVNGNITPQFVIDGYGIVNSFTKLTIPPVIGSITVTPTGGTIKGGQVIVLGAWAQASDGLFTRMALYSVEIPMGTNTNAVQFTLSFANASDVGWTAITTDTNAGWYGAGGVAVSSSSTAVIQPQLQILATAALTASNAGGLTVDQWIELWQQVTGVVMTPAQALAVAEITGISGFINISAFLSAVATVLTNVSTYGFTQIGELDTPVPDEQFDHYTVQGRTAYVAGANGGTITQIDTTTGNIVFLPASSMPPAGTWVGRVLSVYANPAAIDPTTSLPYACNPLPILDVPITAQDSTSVTIDPAAIAATGIMMGSLMLVKLTATAASPTYIEDNTLAYWTNFQPPNQNSPIQGLTPNAYVGKLLLVTRDPNGNGAGQLSTVQSNTGVGFTVAPPFPITPSVGAEFLVINSTVDYESDSNSLLFTAIETLPGANAGTPPTAYPSSTQFTPTPPSGSEVEIGAPWTVVITGAAPNSDVSVVSVPSSGPTVPSQYEGMTDANGNFTLSGVFPSLTPQGNSAIGSWVQTWYVGGAAATGYTGAVVVGIWEFSIATNPIGNNPTVVGGTGTPVELTLTVDNSWRHFFVQVLTGNSEDVESMVTYSPFRVMFQPGFTGPNNLGTPSDNFYVGFGPQGVAANIPLLGQSTIQYEQIPGTLYAWDATVENPGASPIVMDVLRMRTIIDPVTLIATTTVVSIFGVADPNPALLPGGTGSAVAATPTAVTPITIPANSILTAVGTAFDPAASDILSGDILQLVVLSVDGTTPGQRATVNLFWKNAPITAGAGVSQ